MDTTEFNKKVTEIQGDFINDLIGRGIPQPDAIGLLYATMDMLTKIFSTPLGDLIAREAERALCDGKQP